MVFSPVRLAVSIVTYAPDLDLLEQTLTALNSSLRYARRGVSQARLWVVDNGPGPVWRRRLQELLNQNHLIDAFDDVELLGGHGNIGYGRGHNLTIQSADDYHLVLNPDVLLAEDALLEALNFMIAHPEAGLLAPAAADEFGNQLYLCKRYPTLFDFLLRGFTPAFIKRRFQSRLDHYELRDLIAHAVVWDVPLVSGCCMLFKGPALSRVRGFSPDYFLYFEDYDISLRVAQTARTVYVPAVRITHFGGHAAGKGWRHLQLFLCSAITFFRQHTWKWC